MKIALSLGADCSDRALLSKKVKPKLMEKRFINLKQVQILIKINLIFYVNYRRAISEISVSIGALSLKFEK
jgi:hypothetical protein